MGGAVGGSPGGRWECCLRDGAGLKYGRLSDGSRKKLVQTEPTGPS